MKNKISLKYTNGVTLPLTKLEQNNIVLVASLNASMMQLGFIASKELFDGMCILPESEIVSLYNDLIPALQKMKGADVKYKPMYPNFPQQVMEASYVELYVNAILHYWSAGQWMPNYEELPREVHFEKTQFKEIGLTYELEFCNIFTQLLSSNDSISDEDKKTVKWFIDNKTMLTYPENIPFKENLCYVAALLLEDGKDISELMKTSTDVLRVITSLSDGDISLASNTKFKSLPRELRRMFVGVLEDVINEEDINRHRNKWTKLFHNLHVGDYQYAKKVNVVAKKIRNNKKIETFAGRVQHAVDTKDVTSAVDLLVTRPSEFARRVDHLIRLSARKKTFIVETFLSVVDNVPTRILMQLLGNLKVRHEDSHDKIIFPKGNVQRALVIETDTPKLSGKHINMLSDGIKESLLARFNGLDEMGNVWIDPDLKGCPLPTQQRSASEGLFSVARGTKLPIGDKNTLRFFIYWIGYYDYSTLAQQQGPIYVSLLHCRKQGRSQNTMAQISETRQQSIAL